MEEILTAWFSDDDLLRQGLPSVQFIADTLKVSPGYLSGLLKTLTGQSTQQHIHEALIEKAKERLSTTGLSVNEIAYGLGFEHSQSFSKLFKTKTHQSPLEFRASFNLTEGIDYVQHIASPFPLTSPKDDDELIVPAMAGVLNILKAASTNKIKRVVLTSASCSVLNGKPKGRESGTFNETVWADENNTADTTPYYRSKIIAEKTAWDYVKQDKSELELVTVLPGAMLGPALEIDFGTSATIILKMLDGSLPAVPQVGFNIADVRSVANLHILAMENHKAAGQRFLGTSGLMTVKEIADILRQRYPSRKIPSCKLPNWLTRVASWFDKSMEPILLDLGKERKADSSKARNLLGWKPIDNKEAVLSCAESLISLGLIK